jgi:hypothetical protein
MVSILPSIKSLQTIKCLTTAFALLIVLFAHAQVQTPSCIAADDAKRNLPLKEAIQSKCSGVSIKLKLGNDGNLTCNGKSFSDVYLKQLPNVNPESNPFLLVAQFEGDSSKIATALNKALMPYKELFCSLNGNEEYSRKFKLLLWGDIPYAEIQALKVRSFYTIFMMRKGSSRGKSKADVLGIDFENLYKWNGRESMPNMQYHGLQTNLKTAHKSGQKTILFDAPETFNAWNILSNAGTDYFVVSDIEKFNRFLKDK